LNNNLINENTVLIKQRKILNVEKNKVEELEKQNHNRCREATIMCDNYFLTNLQKHS